jgi:hypothetical protein
MPYFTLFILSTNSLNEFCVDRLVCVNLESAYRTGNQCCASENVYGYVITEHDEASWSVVSESVYGCDYTVYENNGRIDIHEGRSRLVMV